MSDQIEVGDAVYLASNPRTKMTVTSIFEGDANVSWIADGDMKYSTVPVAALQKVQYRDRG